MPQSASSGVWVHVHVYIYIYRYLHIHMYADVLYGILSSEAPLPVRVKQRLAGVQLMPFWPLTLWHCSYVAVSRWFKAIPSICTLDGSGNN